LIVSSSLMSAADIQARIGAVPLRSKDRTRDRDAGWSHSVCVYGSDDDERPLSDHLARLCTLIESNRHTIDSIIQSGAGAIIRVMCASDAEASIRISVPVVRRVAATGLHVHVDTFPPEPDGSTEVGDVSITTVGIEMSVADLFQAMPFRHMWTSSGLDVAYRPNPDASERAGSVLLSTRPKREMLEDVEVQAGRILAYAHDRVPETLSRDDRALILTSSSSTGQANYVLTSEMLASCSRAGVALELHLHSVAPGSG
jgi:hypothetical protein